MPPAPAARRSAVTNQPHGRDGVWTRSGWQIPPHEHPVEPVLGCAMRLDETHMGVHREILVHRHMGIEPQGGESVTARLAHRVIDQPTSRTHALARRVDRYVI